MPEISTEFAAVIRAGDCVLWTGAGIGAWAGRPTWAERLRTACEQRDGDSGVAEALALIAAGRNAEVAQWLGDSLDEPSDDSDDSDDGEPGGLPEATARSLGALPWRGCLANGHLELVRAALTSQGRTVHDSTDSPESPKSPESPYPLLTLGRSGLGPPTDATAGWIARSSRACTLLMLGFEIGDPDLARALALITEHAGNTPHPRHQLWIPEGAGPLATDVILSACVAAGVDLVTFPEGELDAALAGLVDAVGVEADAPAPGPSLADPALARLSLAARLQKLPARADLAAAVLEAMPEAELEALTDAATELPGGPETLPAPARLRLASLWVAQSPDSESDSDSESRYEAARGLLTALAEADSDSDSGVTRADRALAHFNLALAALGAGDETGCRKQLAAAAELEPGLALTPARLSAARLTELADPQPAQPDTQPDPRVGQDKLALDPDDPDDLDAWIAVLERKPSHLPAREAVARIERESRGAQRWDRVAEAISVRVGLSQAESETIVLLRELSAIYEDQLAAPSDALDALLALSETISITAQLPLVDELLRLAEVTGRWRPTAERLEAMGPLLPQLEDQLRVLTTAAELFLAQIGDKDGAVRAYEAALALAPEQLEILHPAIAAYRSADRPAELATGLLTIAELEQGDARHDALLEAADLLGELGEVEGALTAAETVREEDPNNDRALAASERWARALERWAVLAEVLAARASDTLDDAEAKAARREAAELMRTHLDDEPGAIAQYRALIERDRGDVEAAEALVELLRPRLEQPEGQTPAGDSRELSTADAREGLIDALTVLSDAIDDIGRRGTLLAETASLLEGEADGSERAADCRERIVATMPVDHALVGAAVEALIRHYGATENHRAAATLLEARAESAALDPEIRADSLRALRELAAGDLSDPELERRTLEALVELEPDQAQWRDALIELLREGGDDERAASMLRERISATDSPQERAAMMIEVARMRERAGELDEAETGVRAALELDEAAHTGWALLREILEQRERPLEALEALVREGQTQTDPREKVRTLFTAAKTWLQTVGQPERGMPLLAEILELDPHHEQATALYTDGLVARGELEAAWPHAQRWITQIRVSDPDNRPVQAHAHALAARCALAVGEKERARELLRTAKEADPRNREVAQTLADLELESENWSAALKAYQGLALQQSNSDTNSSEDMAALYLRMGRARRGMGEQGKSRQMVDRALELDPTHVEAARFLVTLADTPALRVESRERLIEVIEAGIRSLPEDPDGADEPAGSDAPDSSGDSDDSDDSNDPGREGPRAALERELLEVRVGLATTLTKELDRPREAIPHLQAALDRRPEDLALLHQALDLYSSAELWHEAVGVLDRLAQLQTNSAIESKYRYAGASLIRAHELDPSGDEIQARMLAVLELDPLHDKAFKTAVDMLAAPEHARGLSKVLRGRLKALPEDTPTSERVALLERIAALYENALDDKNTAMIAYEQAAGLALAAGLDSDEAKAEQIARRAKVIGLAVQLGGDALDKGIEQVQALIRQSPLDYDSYHRLVELYLAAQQRDAAVSVARTLRFLKQADEAELELAGTLGANYQPPRGSLTRKQWRSVILGDHPSMRLSDLYGLLWPVIAGREGRPYSALNLSRDQREPVNMQASGIARWLAYMAQIIDMPTPDLFARKGESGGFSVTALGDKSGVYPTLLAGDDALAKQPEAALAFRAGRAVAHTHPHLFGAALLPSSSSLRNVIYGAVAVTHPKVPIPKDLRDSTLGWGEAIKKRLPQSRIDDLGKTVAKVIDGGGADTKAWLCGCEIAATRAGFLMADSLEVSTRVILQGGGGTVEGREQIMGLVAFSVSDPYLKLRRALKLGQ